MEFPDAQPVKQADGIGRHEDRRMLLHGDEEIPALRRGHDLDVVGMGGRPEDFDTGHGIVLTDSTVAREGKEAVQDPAMAGLGGSAGFGIAAHEQPNQIGCDGCDSGIMPKRCGPLHHEPAGTLVAITTARLLVSDRTQSSATAETVRGDAAASALAKSMAAATTSAGSSPCFYDTRYGWHRMISIGLRQCHSTCHSVKHQHDTQIQQVVERRCEEKQPPSPAFFGHQQQAQQDDDWNETNARDLETAAGKLLNPLALQVDKGASGNKSGA